MERADVPKRGRPDQLVFEKEELFLGRFEQQGVDGVWIGYREPSGDHDAACAAPASEPVQAWLLAQGNGLDKFPSRKRAVVWRGLQQVVQRRRTRAVPTQDEGRSLYWSVHHLRIRFQVLDEPEVLTSFPC